MPFWTHIQILHLHILFYSQVYTDNDNFLLTDMDNLILKALGNLRIYRQMLWRCRLHLHLAYIIIFEVLFDALDILYFEFHSTFWDFWTLHFPVRGQRKKKFKGKNLLLLFFPSCLIYIYEEMIFWDVELSIFTLLIGFLHSWYSEYITVWCKTH